MFSYDDRLRTVQLCIKLGKRVGLTIRQLGYPTKNALKARHRAYEQRNGLSEGYVRGPKYTQAQKDLAVDHFVSSGRCIAVTIKALGYPSSSLLASWIRQVHPELPPRVGHAHEALSSAAKQSAVMALCLRRGSAQAVAEELGVSRPSLYSATRGQTLTGNPAGKRRSTACRASSTCSTGVLHPNSLKNRASVQEEGNGTGSTAGLDMKLPGLARRDAM